jgi:hypothetical protein
MSTILHASKIAACHAALLALLAPLPAAASDAMAHGAMAGENTAHEVRFTIRVENISTAQTLKLSNGMTAPAPTAPIMWAITDKGNPLFTAGTPDRGQGLEPLSEDGNPGVLADYFSRHPQGIAHSGAVTIPVGDTAAGPIGPGHAFEFSVSAKPGQHLTMAMMFVQSNDLFYAPDSNAIALFDDKGKALTGDITSQFKLWDAGTEVNEEPGLGPNQAHRQVALNTGVEERGLVRLVHDEFVYPSNAQVMRVTIRPTTSGTAGK